MRNKNQTRQHERRREYPTPARVAWDAYLLADDTLHSGISRVAEGIGRRCDIKKKTLAYGTFATGTAITGAILATEPMIGISFGAIGAIAFVVYGRLMEKAMETKAQTGALAQSIESMFLKISRFPAILFGAYKIGQFISDGAKSNLAVGIYMGAFALAAYLASTGRGLFDKAVEKLKEKLPEQACEYVPVEIDGKERRR